MPQVNRINDIPKDGSSLLEYLNNNITVKDILFSGFSISNIDFSGDDLEGVLLQDVTFINCLFINACLVDSSLENVKFDSCILDNADFDGGGIDIVVFKKCNIDRTSFISAAIKDAIFIECTGAVDMSDAEVKKTIFNTCDLDESDFSEADLEASSFLTCSFREVAINKNTSLHRVLIHKSDITGTPLQEALQYDQRNVSFCRATPWDEVTKKVREKKESTTLGTLYGPPQANWQQKSSTGPAKSAFLFCSHPSEYNGVSRENLYSL